MFDSVFESTFDSFTFLRQSLYWLFIETSFLVGVENTGTGLGLTWQGENLNQSERSGDVSVHCPVPGSCLAPDTGCLVIRFSASQLTCGDGVK